MNPNIIAYQAIKRERAIIYDIRQGFVAVCGYGPGNVPEVFDGHPLLARLARHDADVWDALITLYRSEVIADKVLAFIDDEEELNIYDITKA